MNIPSLLRVVSPVLVVSFQTCSRAADSLSDKPRLAAWCIAPRDDARKLVDAAPLALPGKIRGTAFHSSECLHRQGEQLYFDAASSRESRKRDVAEFQKLTAGE